MASTAPANVKRSAAYKRSWLSRYGLEISARDSKTSEVVSLRCRFCGKGRDVDCDEVATRKRKKTERIKLYNKPLRCVIISNDI